MACLLAKTQSFQSSVPRKARVNLPSLLTKREALKPRELLKCDGSMPIARSSSSPTFRHPAGGEWDGRFRYIRFVLGERDAILEFETVMAGRYVNGVDMITCDDDGKIVDFKVMVRPMQAVDAVRELMLRALEQLQGGGEL